MNEKNSINEAITNTLDIRCRIQTCEGIEFWLRDFQENIDNEESAIIENTVDILNDFLWNSDCPIDEIIERGDDVVAFLSLIEKHTENEKIRSVLKKSTEIIKKYCS